MSSGGSAPVSTGFEPRISASTLSVDSSYSLALALQDVGDMLYFCREKVVVVRSTEGEVRVQAAQRLEKGEIVLAPSIPNLSFIEKDQGLEKEYPRSAVRLTWHGENLVILPCSKFICPFWCMARSGSSDRANCSLSFERARGFVDMGFREGDMQVGTKNKMSEYDGGVPVITNDEAIENGVELVLKMDDCVSKSPPTVVP